VAQYALQSVGLIYFQTACLQAKREEVLQLWQQNLPNSDPNLLAELEKANQLALEATKEVAKLRNAIQELQNVRNQIHIVILFIYEEEL
jgi:hypothetical protein